MRKTSITYGQLYGVLQSLGFQERVEKGKHRLYEHTATGALMSLPDRKPNETANVTYIAAVRTVLSNYDIADEVEFVSQLQKAS
jgi:predicted RNA binding protein YcfA (HicA-like mRNA interferase family)